MHVTVTVVYAGSRAKRMAKASMPDDASLKPRADCMSVSDLSSAAALELHARYQRLLSRLARSEERWRTGRRWRYICKWLLAWFTQNWKGLFCNNFVKITIKLQTITWLFQSVTTYSSDFFHILISINISQKLRQIRGPIWCSPCKLSLFIAVLRPKYTRPKVYTQ